jgi:hypothetical protein
VSKILFWQTADENKYAAMLAVTANQNARYCSLKGYQYEKFLGIKRGYADWQAIFNRIIKIKELLDSGFSDWFVYADADSYVYDMSFDLQNYLNQKKEFAFIAATGGDKRRLAVNSGVFFLNFAHPSGKKLAQLWYDAFAAVSDEYLRTSIRWMDDGVNDQSLLHQVLFRHNEEYEAASYVESESLINYDGTFMKQALRAYYKTIYNRTENIINNIERSRAQFLVHV